MKKLKHLLAIGLALVLVLVSLPTPVAAQSAEIFFWPADSGPAGTWVGVGGYGFTPYSVITITWDGNPIDTETEVVTDSGGWFGAMILVPDVPEGDYMVMATDGSGLWAEALFSVGPPYSGIWLFPADSGPSGTWVGIMGYGFTPDSVISITWDGELIATEPEPVITTPWGWFGATIVVPNVPEGEYIVVATDEEGLWAGAIFRVTSPPAPEIWLGRSRGQVGDWVSIHGWNFAPDSDITVTWNGEPIETDPDIVVTDSPWGWFHTSIIVPNVPDGDYTIRATDGDGRWAQAILTIGPGISPWPSYGAVGAWVYIYGEGFTPDSVVTITWDGDPMTTEPEEVATDHWGYFSAIVEVPDVEDGDYIIRATDGVGRWAEALFTVGPPLPPDLWVSPWQGPPGRWVGVDGRGFAPESMISITWDGGPVETDPGVVVTDHWGGFWARILVPDVEDGDYTIMATDGEGRWAQAIFTVGPPLPYDRLIWPLDGPVGTVVSLSGGDFTPDSIITITWDGDPIDTEPALVMTDPWGGFWAEIIVPDVPEGYYTITATDKEGLWMGALFWVSPPPPPPFQIGLEPECGPVGTLVTIYGWGFESDSVLAITWDGDPIATRPEVVTTPWGGFRASVVVPDVPEGECTIRVTDGGGLWVEKTFTVVAPPLTPQQAVEDLICDIEALELNRGTENSLVRKLEAAISSLDRGQTKAAANQLGAFINEVNALKDKRLADAEASAMIEQARTIIDSL